MRKVVGVERFELSPLLAQLGAAVIDLNKINDLQIRLGSAWRKLAYFEL